MAWVACVSTIAEGRRTKVLKAVTKAIRSVPGIDLRSRHSDEDLNRSVFTFVGSPDAVCEAAFRCAQAAKEQIDLGKREGAAILTGAVDSILLTPLAQTKMAHCQSWADTLGKRVERELEIPAAAPGSAGKIDQPHPLAGAVVVGAQELAIEFNALLDTDDLDLGRSIASSIDEGNEGLPHVRARAYALPSRECVVVSLTLADYRKSSPLRAYRQVRRVAREAGVDVTGTEFVGVVPADAVTRGFRSSLRSGSVKVLDPEPPFLDLVASRAPVPAGGSAAAHTAALGAALVVMSCDASAPKPRLSELRNDADRLRAELTALVDLDVAAFRRVLKERSEDALKEATEVPVRIAECAAELWAVAAAAGNHCDEMVATDCSGGRRLAEAARDMAAETARHNLPKIQDGTFRSRVARRLAAAFSG